MQIIEQANSLLALMREQAESGDFWKNIPLAQEYALRIEELLHDEDCDWWDTLAFCDAILLEELLNQRDTPRLCLRFMALRNQILQQTRREASPEEYQELHLTEEAALAIQQKLTDYIDPATRMEDWLHQYGGMLRFDPVEMTPQWEEAIFEVECECEKKLTKANRGMGFCFTYWSTKATILAKKGIIWRSPSLMNPRVMFD